MLADWRGKSTGLGPSWEAPVPTAHLRSFLLPRCRLKDSLQLRSPRFSPRALSPTLTWPAYPASHYSSSGCHVCNIRVSGTLIGQVSDSVLKELS